MKSSSIIVFFFNLPKFPIHVVSLIFDQISWFWLDHDSSSEKKEKKPIVWWTQGVLYVFNFLTACWLQSNLPT